MMTRPRRLFEFPWRSRATIDGDVEAELQFHLDARAADLVAAGVPADQALRQARAEFGDLDFTRRYCRDLDTRTERGNRMTDRLGAWRLDLRFAWRTFRRHPAFALVTIVTLALAIGANTAIFSVARTVLFKPLPYGEPAALVALFSTPLESPGNRWDFSAPDLADYRSRQRSLTAIGAYSYRQLTTWRPGTGDPQIVNAMPVTANLFEVLRVGAWRGRTFAAGDDAPSAAPTVVVSYAFWQRALGSDPATIGSTMTLSELPYRVIGIMPRGFTVRGQEDMWIPLDMSGDLANPGVTRKQHVFAALARLKPGVSIEAARSDLMAIARRLQGEYPESNARFLATAEFLSERASAGLERPLLLLLAASVAVLLIACANLANLTLARTMGRRTEIAVRAALGAGRSRLARQLLTESLLLALIGGAVGVAVAAAATRAILALNPNALPPMFEVGIDGGVLGFGLLLSLGTGVLFGLLPALDAGRADLHATLKSEGRSGTGSRSSERARRGLVVAQVGLAVVLLVGAGLLIRSFRDLTQVRLGFEPDHLLTAQLRLDGARYDSAGAVNRFYDEVLSTVGAAPGVVAVGATMHLPMQGGENSSIYVEGAALGAEGPRDIGYTMVRGDYFKAMRIPLVEGRTFDATDSPEAGGGTALLNQAAVRVFFPKGDAVGHRVRIGPNPAAPWTTIIGVVADIRERALDTPAQPLYYDNGRRQTWWGSFSLVVRTGAEPMALLPVVRTAVKRADPVLAVRGFETLEHVIGSSLAARRFALGIAAAFAGLAMVLAAVGIYGVLAYSVSARSREFGVRIALGASTRTVLRLVLRQGLSWSLAGLALGIAGAMAGSRLLAGMLYGVTSFDLPTYLAVAAGLLIVTISASVIPALRAARADPLDSIRTE